VPINLRQLTVSILKCSSIFQSVVIFVKNYTTQKQAIFKIVILIFYYSKIIFVKVTPTSFGPPPTGSPLSAAAVANLGRYVADDGTRTPFSHRLSLNILVNDETVSDEVRDYELTPDNNSLLSNIDVGTIEEYWCVKKQLIFSEQLQKVARQLHFE